MNRRQRGQGGNRVRGPNSALTEFLREQGISAAEIRERHLERQAAAEGQEQREEEVDAEDAEIIANANRKRRLDDDEDEDDASNELGGVSKPLPGKEMNCAECGVQFTVNVYSRSNSSGGVLCTNCTALANEADKEKKSKELAARKYRKKLAAALLDRKEWRIPKLQDICINTITKHIDDVEAFGEIGNINLTKISRILSKNRKLSPVSIKLFLDPGARALEFWDCSNVDSDSLKMIASMSPNLESLVLSMCGLMHNDCLLYLAEKLTRCRSWYLDGAFLVNEATWDKFFETVGERLEELTISNTHRLTDQNLAMMVTLCPNIRRLSLRRLASLKEPASITLLSELSLVSFELSHPDPQHCEDLVVDASICEILEANKGRLVSLNLSGCSGLTDVIVPSLQGCAVLEELRLEQLDQISDEAVESLFRGWTANSGLHTLSVTKCVGLQAGALSAILAHSKDTLVELFVGGLPLMTREPLQQINGAKNLTTLDVGFLRAVEDDLVEQWNATCPSLTLVTVYGDLKVTGRCRTQNMRLIGRQTDTV